MNQNTRCQSTNVIASDILCFGHPHIQDSCLATGIQAEDAESLGSFLCPTQLEWLG